MSYKEPRRFTCFTKQLDDLKARYPHSSAEIDRQLNAILDNPDCGDRIPRCKGFHLRKQRILLAYYGISKANGGRVIFMRLEENKTIVMIAIHLKKDWPEEKKLAKHIEKCIKDIEIEIKESDPLP